MYSAALFPDRIRAGGLLLQAFSLGHALLLQRLRSPLDWSSKTDAKPGFGDLLLAVGLCGRPYPEALRWLDSSRMRYWMKWKGITRAAWFPFDLARFTRYLAQGWDGPRVWIRQGDGGRSHTDFLHLIKLVLEVNFGRPEAQVLAMPLRAALWDFNAWLETQGTVEIWSAQDFELAQAAERMANEVGRNRCAGN